MSFACNIELSKLVRGPFSSRGQFSFVTTPRLCAFIPMLHTELTVLRSCSLDLPADYISTFAFFNALDSK